MEISIERDKLDKLQAQLLAVSLIDLDLGLLSFGGQQEQDTEMQYNSIYCEWSGYAQSDQNKKQSFLEEYV